MATAPTIEQDLGARPSEDSFVSRYTTTISRFARRQPLGAACALILVLLVVVALTADLIAPYSPTKNDVGPVLSDPTSSHLFGTDEFGRDVMTRVIYGARTSLYVGLGATLIAITGATIIGTVSAYLGGSVDYVVQRFVDAAMAIPPLILLIAIMLVLGPSIQNVIIALSLQGSLSGSRVIRGTVIGIRSYQFIEAARVVGASHIRIMARHILPNLIPIMLISMSISIGGYIVAEASLSFIGLGVPPPNPSWGGMISNSGRVYMIINPWLLVFPIVALAMVVYSMNMFGDALRDEIDPRLRGSR